jgi:DNA invertase Pin-like site-specific DNA recombinase
MDWIYARVSTEGQNTDAQTVALLERYPNALVVTETASGAKTRPQLDSLIARLGKGDRLIVAALDRLGRSLQDAIDKINQLQKKGVILISARENVDFTTATGKLVMHVLLSVAEMERGLISERTIASLKVSKINGVKLGRPTIYAPDTESRIVEMLGKKSYQVIANELGVTKALVSYYARKHGYARKLPQREPDPAD